jgi:hypothetical protein
MTNNFWWIQNNSLSLFLTIKKNKTMNQEQVITYLQSLDINELGDLLIEVGAFRNQEVCKSEVEDQNGIELLLFDLSHS